MSSKDKIRSNDIFGTIAAVVMAVIGLWLLFAAVQHHDEKILGNGQSPTPHTSYSFLSSDAVSSNEQRISALFAADTLPGLIRKGLIKKYERTDSGTMVTVAGQIWNERSQFFKQSLLTALFVYNKVNGYTPHTRVVDNTSGLLYAEILPSSEMKLYN
jgi:hypothetical protein